MKPSFKLLTELIPLIAEFESTNQKVDMPHFLKFVTQKNERMPSKADSQNNETQMISNQLGFFLNYLFRFLKGYIKVGLRKSSISNSDEFIFLATLSRETSMRKTDLIKVNMMETPSGTEVIKRLLKSKLVTEEADKEDKRSVRIKLTEKAKKELGLIFGEMNIVSQVLVGNLKAVEIKQLHTLLEKLFNHHQALKDVDYSNGLEVLLK